jgi:hypothetical protein
LPIDIQPAGHGTDQGMLMAELDMAKLRKSVWE